MKEQRVASQVRATCGGRLWQRRLEETYESMNRLRRCSFSSKICAAVLKFAGRMGATSLLAGTIPPSSVAIRAAFTCTIGLVANRMVKAILNRDPTIRMVRRRASVPLGRDWSQLRSESLGNGRHAGVGRVPSAKRLDDFHAFGRAAADWLLDRGRAPRNGRSRPSYSRTRVCLHCRLCHCSFGWCANQRDPHVTAPTGRSSLGSRRLDRRFDS